MTDKMKNNYWTTYWGYLLCRFLEKGNEFCDCGADHTYYGCSRCRSALDEPDV